MQKSQAIHPDQPVNEPESLTISPSDPIVEVGDTVQLSAEVTPSEADQAVIWSSHNKDIATVDSNGLVTGVSEGSGRIRATSAKEVTVDQKVTVTVRSAGASKASTQSVDQQPLQDLTVEELKQQAKDDGHTGYSSMTKSELIDLLQKSEN